jgi:hypothetical protein
MAWWEDWLTDLLPTKWSQRLAVVTIAVAGSAYSLPSILPDSYLPESPEQKFLLRLVLLLLATTIGTISILITVVRAHNKLKALPVPKQIPARQKEAEKQIKRLDEPLEELLELVARFPNQRHSEFAGALKVHPQIALHYLETLQSFGLVDVHYVPGGPDWYVTPKGRVYLAKFGLLDN